MVRLAAAPARCDHQAARWVARLAGIGADILALAAATLLTGHTGSAGVLYPVLALVVLAATQSYRPRLHLSALDGAPRVAAALAAPLLVLAPLAADGRVLRQAAVALPLVLLGRGAAGAAVRAARRGGLRERVLLAGTGNLAIELAGIIEAHPEYGLTVDGFVGAPDAALPAPRHGDLPDLEHVVLRTGVRTVIVAFDPSREAETVPLLRAAVRHGVDLFVVPRFFELGVAPRGVDVDDLWGIPLHRVRQAALRPVSLRVKRATDVVLGSLLLVLSLPLMAVSAAMVRAMGPGPVLFRQRRIGQGGREFEIVKFRTLPADHVDAAWNTDEAEVPHPCGRLLRRFCLDELPQLWNVVRGDMSLVGPRPERSHLVAHFDQRVHGYRDRHRMPVGLTGWAQVHGLRGETSLRERVRFDNHYIEHWSLWRDVVVLLRTLSSFFRRPNPASKPDAGTEVGHVAAAASGASDPVVPRRELA